MGRSKFRHGNRVGGVRFGSKADMTTNLLNDRFTAKADIRRASQFGR